MAKNKILSFVQRAKYIEQTALVYIRETITDNGEVTIDFGDEDPYEYGLVEGLVVPFYDHFTGESKNLAITKIKATSIVGIDDGGEELEVDSSDFADGTAMWVADYVARTYGDL